ncbi:hypothetical protein D3C81_975090 [compost metagenome]
MPPAVVTRTSTVPVPAGAVAVTCVGLLMVTPEAAVVPKATAVVPVKPVPVMTTLLPPATGPKAGVIPLTTGACI